MTIRDLVCDGRQFCNVSPVISSCDENHKLVIR
jgi:hypothetical protein